MRRIRRNLRAVGLEPIPAGLEAGLSDKVTTTPLLVQDGFGYGGAELPADGLSYCGPTAAAMSLLWLGKNGWNQLPDVADRLRDIMAIDGVTTHIAGAGGQAADSAEAFAGIDGTLLFASLGVVIVILLFTYRSPILWLLPIVSAMFALFTSQAVIYFLAKDAGLTVNGQSQGILTVLVVGAGTDYALLLVARYREELRRHEDRHEAMAFALHRAAPAIFASAATVAVSMLCLSFADLNSTAGLGPVLAIGVAVTMLVMVTLLPALLVICGRWVFWPKRPTFGSEEPTTSGFWAKVGAWIAPRPRKVWVITAVVLGIAALGAFRLDVVVDRDIGAGARQLQRDLAADAAPAAGHERRAPAQCRRHVRCHRRGLTCPCSIRRR